MILNYIYVSPTHNKVSCLQDPLAYTLTLQHPGLLWTGSAARHPGSVLLARLSVFQAGSRTAETESGKNYQHYVRQQSGLCPVHLHLSPVRNSNPLLYIHLRTGAQCCFSRPGRAWPQPTGRRLFGSWFLSANQQCSVRQRPDGKRSAKQRNTSGLLFEPV